MPKTQTYTKINTLYKRFMNLNKVELPNPEWRAFQNKIILGDFSDEFMSYISNLEFDCTSKIDGTNSKIVFYPSTGVCFCGGKTDNADIYHNGQKDFLDEIISRIQPILAEMFPPETAKFAPALNDQNQIEPMDIIPYRDSIIGDTFVFEPKTSQPIDGNTYGVKFVECPIYIYGEFYGKKIQKAGGNYDKDKNRFAVFDICQQGWWLPKDILDEYCTQLGLEQVPYIGRMTIEDAENMVRQGFNTLVPNANNPDFIEEGIVARPVVPIKDPRGKRIIVKIKHCDYQELDAAIAKLGWEEYNKFEYWYVTNRDMIENIDKPKEE